MTIWNALTVLALVWCAYLAVRVRAEAITLEAVIQLLEKVAGVRFK